jgi:hypothetical protein
LDLYFVCPSLLRTGTINLRPHRCPSPSPVALPYEALSIHNKVRALSECTASSLRSRYCICGVHELGNSLKPPSRLSECSVDAVSNKYSRPALRLSHVACRMSHVACRTSHDQAAGAPHNLSGVCALVQSLCRHTHQTQINPSTTVLYCTVLYREEKTGDGGLSEE